MNKKVREFEQVYSDLKIKNLCMIAWEKNILIEGGHHYRLLFQQFLCFNKIAFYRSFLHI